MENLHTTPNHPSGSSASQTVSDEPRASNEHLNLAREGTEHQQTLADLEEIDIDDVDMDALEGDDLIRFMENLQHRAVARSVAILDQEGTNEI
jgi:hypothetical protein